MQTLKLHHVLRRLLKERGLKMTELARISGVAQSTLATWAIEGTKPADPSQIAAVAKALGVTMHALLFDEAETHVTELSCFPTEQILDGFYRLRLEKVVLPKTGEKKP